MKEGIRGIFLHGFMSFAAVCVTVACLLIVGSFSCLVYNVNLMVEDLNKTNEVLVYVDETLSDADAKSVGTKINRLDNIQQAKFVSREEALENFIADHEDESESFTGLVSEDLRHRFVVTLEDNNLMEQTLDELWLIPGVVNITASLEMAEGFATLQSVLQIASVAVISVLLVVSLLIISNTVKLAIYDRKEEIAIMKMVGATNSFIRWPFVVEGFILGVLAAAIAFFSEWGLYNLLETRINMVDSLDLFNIVPFMNVIEIVAIGYAIVGFVVGVFGSSMSIRKFLKV